MCEIELTSIGDYSPRILALQRSVYRLWTLNSLLISAEILSGCRSSTRTTHLNTPYHCFTRAIRRAAWRNLSLASVYHKPEETFVGRGRIGADAIRKGNEANDRSSTKKALQTVAAGQQAENLLISTMHPQWTKSLLVSQRHKCLPRRQPQQTCSQARRVTLGRPRVNFWRRGRWDVGFNTGAELWLWKWKLWVGDRLVVRSCNAESPPLQQSHSQSTQQEDLLGLF
ncbi:hypothetical protein H2248_010363 [Termitomyces sp. 'cryptogamus']|nr:hypothetical protein H2248_010363 [Termitomyces sp. 'cryptogamus']